jgi:hypothetical protein
VVPSCPPFDRQPRQASPATITHCKAGASSGRSAASAVGGFLNVLTGGKATNAPATNAPSTNAAPKPFNPLDLLNRGKK